MQVAAMSIDFETNVARLATQIQQATTSVVGSVRQMQGAVEMLKGGLAALGVTVSVGFFVHWIRETIDAADQMGKLSERTGLATEALSQLQFVGKQSGVSIDDMATGLKKLNVSINDGLAGNAKQVEAFKNLGISLKDSSGQAKSTREILMALADSFSHATDGATKTAYATTLLGKAGDVWIPMLNKGSAAIEELMSTADKLGLTISGDFARKADEFNTNLSIINSSSQKLAITLGGGLVDSFGAITRAMAEASVSGGKMHALAVGLDELGNQLFNWSGHQQLKAINNIRDDIKHLTAELNAPVADLFGQMDGIRTQLEQKTKELDAALTKYFNLTNGKAGGGRGSVNPPLLGDPGSIAQQTAKMLKPLSAGIAEVETDYARLIRTVAEHVAQQDAELEKGGELTEFEKLEAKIIADVDNARKKLTVTEKVAVDAALQLAKVKAAAQLAQREDNAENLKYADSLYETTRALQQQVKDQADLTAQIGVSSVALAHLIAAKLDDKAATLEQRAAVLDLIDWTGKLGDELRAQAQAYRTLGADKITDATKAQTQALEDGNAQLKLQASLLGATSQEQAVALGNLQIDLKLQRDLLAVENDRAMVGQKLVDAKAALYAGAAAQKAQVAERAALEDQITWLGKIESTGKEVWDALTQGGTNAAKTIGAALKKFIWDSLYELVAKKWVLSIAASLTGGTAAAGVNAATGGGGLSNTLGAAGINTGWFTDIGATLVGKIASTGAQLYSKGFETLGSTMMDLGNGLAKYSDAITSAGNAIGYASAIYAASQGKWGTAIGSAIGTYFGGPIGSWIGSKIGSWIDSYLSGETRAGGTYRYNPNDGTSFAQGPSGGQIAGDTVIQAINSTVSTINGILTAVGSQAHIAGFIAGLETSTNNRGGVMAGGTLSTGASFGQDGSGSNYAGTFYDASKAFNMTAKEAADAFGLELDQVKIKALQAATDLPKTITAMLKDANGAYINASSLTADETAALLKQIDSVITDVLAFQDAVVKLPFRNLTGLSFDMAASLIAAAGGMAALDANLNTYYTNFYSAEEQRAQTIKNINATVSGAGVTGFDAGAETRAQFRSLVDAQDLTTESGQKMYAALLSVAGAFASITPAADAATAATGDVVQATKTLAEIAQERTGLENQLLQLQGNTVELRNRERAALDESNRALYDQVNALTDANAVAQERAGLESQLLQAQGDTVEMRNRERAALDASNQALYDQINAINDAKAVTQERTGLENQLLQLQGNTVEIRNRERAALDESNRALYDEINALTDAKAVAQERAGLETKLLEVQGNTNELRAQERLALDETNRALYDQINALTDAKAVNQERAGLETKLLELQGNTVALRNQERDALDASNQALYEEINALTDAKAVAQERAGLETKLLQVEGDTVALRAQERSALDATNQGLYDYINTLSDLKAAAQERAGLETKLLELQGNTVELRNRERAALDASNRDLYDYINALTDAKAATDRLAAAERSLDTARSDRLAALQAIQSLGDTIRSNIATTLDSMNNVRQQALAAVQTSEQTVVSAFAALQSEQERTQALVQQAQAAEAAAQQSVIDAITGVSSVLAQSQSKLDAAKQHLADLQTTSASSLTAVAADIDKFLRTLSGTALGANNSAAQAAFNKANFELLASQALAGDSTAATQVVAAAQSALESARVTSGSRSEFLAEEARVRILLSQVQAMAPAAVDPAQQAANDLATATAAVVAAQKEYDDLLARATAAGVNLNLASSADAMDKALQAFATAQSKLADTQAATAAAQADATAASAAVATALVVMNSLGVQIPVTVSQMQGLTNTFGSAVADLTQSRATALAVDADLATAASTLVDQYGVLTNQLATYTSALQDFTTRTAGLDFSQLLHADQLGDLLTRFATSEAVFAAAVKEEADAAIARAALPPGLGGSGTSGTGDTVVTPPPVTTTQNVLGSPDLLEKIDLLLAKTEQFRSESFAYGNTTAANTGGLYRLEDGWDRQGQPVRTRPGDIVETEIA